MLCQHQNTHFIVHFSFLTFEKESFSVGSDLKEIQTLFFVLEICPFSLRVFRLMFLNVNKWPFVFLFF